MAEFFGYDIQLYWDNGAGAAAVAAVRDIEGPGMTLDMVDVASRDTGALQKRIGGLASAGQVTMDIVYDPDAATHAALTTALANSTEGTLYLVMDALAETGWYGRALVSGFQPQPPLENALTAAVTFDLIAMANTLAYLSDAGTDYMIVASGGGYWVA